MFLRRYLRAMEADYFAFRIEANGGFEKPRDLIVAIERIVHVESPGSLRDFLGTERG